VGGDDVLGIGPITYLEYITDTLKKMGASLSIQKHNIFNKVAKYCEKLIDIQFLTGYNNIGKVYKDYMHSPWVESLKIRLLSPTSKTTEIVNERNIAIGKGLSLIKELRYLPEDLFPKSWKLMILDRYFQRMKSLIPYKTNTFWHLFLPEKFGGMNFISVVDSEVVFNRLSDCSKWFLTNFEKIPKLKRRAISSLLRNNSFRGYVIPSERESVSDWLEATAIRQEENPPRFSELVIQRQRLSWLLMDHPEVPANVAVSRLKDLGWQSLNDLTDHLCRGIIFRDIFLGIAKPHVYNTEKLSKRFKKLWELFESDPANLNYKLSLDEFRRIIKAKPDDFFYKVSELPTWGTDFQPTLRIGLRRSLLTDK